jgi:hypothetical protein
LVFGYVDLAVASVGGCGRLYLEWSGVQMRRIRNKIYIYIYKIRNNEKTY